MDYKTSFFSAHYNGQITINLKITSIDSKKTKIHCISKTDKPDKHTFWVPHDHVTINNYPVIMKTSAYLMTKVLKEK